MEQTIILSTMMILDVATGFLEVVPEAADKLHLMSRVSPLWNRLVDHWGHLTALYVEEFPTGKFEKLDARIEKTYQTKSRTAKSEG
jgi:hypothetical protein